MNKDEKQGILFDDFDDLDWWKKEWQNMPEFIMDDLTSFQSVHVHFETIEAREEFSELIDGLREVSAGKKPNGDIYK